MGQRLQDCPGKDCFPIPHHQRRHLPGGGFLPDGSLKPVAIPICLFPIDIGNKAPFSGKCKSNGGLALRVELFAHQLRRKDQVPLFSADAEYLGDDGKHIPAGGTCQIVVNATPIGIKILGNAGVNFACFKCQRGVSQRL